MWDVEFKKFQELMCAELCAVDPELHFQHDTWTHPSGGGGLSCVAKEGAIFERAGVNFSSVTGTLSGPMALELFRSTEPVTFEACGTSIVVHARSPFVPTIHCNLRFFRSEKGSWLGGGSDLTPTYVEESEAVAFHRGLEQIIVESGGTRALYDQWKLACDEYFYLPHRGERRGIGGIFFDYCGRERPADLEATAPIVRGLGARIPRLYYDLVSAAKHRSWNEAHKRFQLLRRGRYVEFNLVYDRGTKFGLVFGGRTESILMSLPPHASWEYCAVPDVGTPEFATTEILRSPRAWI